MREGRERRIYLNGIGTEGPICGRMEMRVHTPARREEVGGRGERPGGTRLRTAKVLGIGGRRKGRMRYRRPTSVGGAEEAREDEEQHS